MTGVWGNGGVARLREAQLVYPERMRYDLESRRWRKESNRPDEMPNHREMRMSGRHTTNIRKSSSDRKMTPALEPSSSQVLRESNRCMDATIFDDEKSAQVPRPRRCRRGQHERAKPPKKKRRQAGADLHHHQKTDMCKVMSIYVTITRINSD